MRRVNKYLRREWERVLCAVLAVLLLAFLVDWALGRRGDDLRAGASRISEPPSILGPSAFAFLGAEEAPTTPGRNPFIGSAVTRPAPRVERPARREPPKPPPAAAPTVAAPVPKPVPVAPPAPPPSAPAAGPRLGLCDVRYVFSTVNRSGRPVALLEFHNPATPGAAPLARNVSVGDLVQGLRIQSFTDETLVLMDASGRRQNVSFGGARRVTVDLSPER